jgi:hypothetical protein
MRCRSMENLAGQRAQKGEESGPTGILTETCGVLAMMVFGYIPWRLPCTSVSNFTSHAVI